MRRWFLVCLLSVGLSIAYTHRSNIAYALASPEFIAQLHLTDTSRGVLGVGTFFLDLRAASATGRVAGGSLRSGKWPLAAGFLLWCLFSASCGLAQGFWSLLGFRLLLGLCEAVVTPAGLRWIRDHAEERRRGTFTGIFFSGSKYGPAIAAPVAMWLIKQHGWRAMFINQGLYGLLWLVPWLLFASSGRPAAKPEKKAALIPEVPAGRFIELFRSRLMWGTLIGTFSYNYFVFYALTWLPAYFVEQRHLSLTSSGFYTGFSYAGMAAMAILGGLRSGLADPARRGSAGRSPRLYHRGSAGGFYAGVRSVGDHYHPSGLLLRPFDHRSGISHGQLLGAPRRPPCPKQWQAGWLGRRTWLSLWLVRSRRSQRDGLNRSAGATARRWPSPVGS